MNKEIQIRISIIASAEFHPYLLARYYLLNTKRVTKISVDGIFPSSAATALPSARELIKATSVSIKTA